MKSAQIFKKIILIAILFLILPNASKAADEINLGKIIVNIHDENNNAYVGNWFLHNGITANGTVVRNGSSGETFNLEAGTYFIEAQKSDNIRPYRLIRSDNPQTVTAGETITFDIQYFQTEDQKNNPGTFAEPVIAEPAAEPAPIVIAPAPSADYTADTTASDDNAEDTSSSDQFGRTYMGPEEPIAISAPAEPTETVTDEIDQATPIELAKTGPEASLLLLAISGLLGGIITMRKK
jgi:hypothetical protein